MSEEDSVDSSNGDDTTALNNNDKESRARVDIPFQTNIRKAITPYLPPPVIHFMRRIDPQLEPLIGKEATINIVGSLFVAWLLFLVVTKLLGSSGSGKAIQEDDHDQNVLQRDDHSTRPFDGTIVLCGPSMSGKTTLFYHLVYRGGSNNNNNNSLCTVKSIRSNTGFMESSNNTWRIVDTPGHWGPDKLLQAITISQVQRILLLVDSTQPVAQAADYLYALWTVMESSCSSATRPQLLVSCHKNKHSKAKNMRRIKLQLRSELERLQKLKAMDHDERSSCPTDWEKNLNEILFCSSNVGQGGMILEDVQQFCESGTILVGNNST
jgi:signal recognition particle receptor subunit beta